MELFQKIKKCSPDSVSNYCMIYREALVIKKLSREKSPRCDLEVGLSAIVKTVNFARFAQVANKIRQ